jgi:SAM-dependent methyltransferase
MAERFGEWRAGITGSPELEWVDDLVDRLPEESDVLELGCGGAVEPTLRLAAAGRLTGIDISEHQLRLARERCPGGNFILGDMTTIELDPESFDAVVSLYAFNHIPRADLPGLIKRIGAWLRPDGYLLATFGVSDSESVQDDWLGVPMFFASHSIGSNRAFVREAGLAIVGDESVVITEPEDGEGRFQWILAWKP